MSGPSLRLCRLTTQLISPVLPSAVLVLLAVAPVELVAIWAARWELSSDSVGCQQLEKILRPFCAAAPAATVRGSIGVGVAPTLPFGVAAFGDDGLADADKGAGGLLALKDGMHAVEVRTFSNIK